jgi:hypothetical protein
MNENDLQNNENQETEQLTDLELGIRTKMNAEWQAS